ncbi:MAG TPA: hypothetical protein PKD31_06860 [Blastocatellia bacterium]|nr:hypothetical protein [Blastocatellia bacterium]
MPGKIGNATKVINLKASGHSETGTRLVTDAYSRFTLQIREEQ